MQEDRYPVSHVVDVEKGLESDPAPGLDQQPYGSPGRHSAPVAATGTPSPVVLGPLAVLKRLFERNPSAVVSGRYTINFRQMLILMVLLTTMTVLWLMSSRPSVEFEMDQDPSIHGSNHKETVFKGGNDKPSDTHREIFDPKAITHERYERVRGKGTKTSLKKIQFAFGPELEEDRVERERRLQAVRDGFEHAWTGYKKHAWGHDEVHPVSGGHKDAFNGWGATMVDSLDTLVIMGFNKEFDEALDWIKNSFNMQKDTTAQLQFFETVIRYLGGLLSAFDLTGEQVLLTKAEELGGYLLNAFQQRNFPAGRFAIKESANRYPPSSYVLAEVGTIQLEFSRLSMLTGKPVYDLKARKIFDVLASATSDMPGLLPSYVREGEGQHYSNYRATVGGMLDSYYEYLLKEWILLDGEPKNYRETFEKAVDSIHKYMALSPDDGSDEYAIIGAVHSNSKDFDPEMEHLSCFIAGSLAMGAKYFERPEDLSLAKKVAEGCYLGYNRSVTGIGPEHMKFPRGKDPKTFGVNQDTFYSRSLSRNEYILRPEALESLWILYRLTGEKKYQDQAWEMFQSLEKHCRTDIAYSGLTDVNKPGSYDNKMESFFMAETMKYLYLMFSTPDVISLDQFVLNTEAHPLRRT